MKSIEFSEEELGNLDLIRQRLFEDASDPRSNSYIRKLNRPHINWLKVIVFALLPFVFVGAIIIFFISLRLSLWLGIGCSAAALLLYAVIISKRAVICLIRIYQRYAKVSLRNKCRFEPSCSEYMILSIEKYGLLKGIKNGFSRFKRCNVNGGGIDYP